jgi:Arc/MetJ-type ribon-helix-helix transcriptional regulator
MSKAIYTHILTANVSPAMAERIKERVKEGSFPNQSSYIRRALARSLKRKIEYRDPDEF